MGRNNKGDIESGFRENIYINNNARDQLYPTMLESPQLRWAFIRKVYAILCMQMLLTTAVAATVVFVRPIPNFVTHTTSGIVVYIFLCLLPFIRKLLPFVLLKFFVFFFFFFVCILLKLITFLFGCCFMICSFNPLVLFPQESPFEFAPSHAVHDYNCICRGTCLCFYKRY
jgi:FtsH-binding integral membrane protein